MQMVDHGTKIQMRIGFTDSVKNNTTIPIKTMQVFRESPFTGEMNVMEINITEEQYERYLMREDLIQNIMPNISAAEREFIMTGYTAQDWKDIFGSEEENA